MKNKKKRKRSYNKRSEDTPKKKRRKRFHNPSNLKSTKQFSNINQLRSELKVKSDRFEKLIQKSEQVQKEKKKISFDISALNVEISSLNDEMIVEKNNNSFSIPKLNRDMRGSEKEIEREKNILMDTMKNMIFSEDFDYNLKGHFQNKVEVIKKKESKLGELKESIVEKQEREKEFVKLIGLKKAEKGRKKSEKKKKKRKLEEIKGKMLNYKNYKEGWDNDLLFQKKELKRDVITHLQLKFQREWKAYEKEIDSY